jgi:hypothetical protein
MNRGTPGDLTSVFYNVDEQGFTWYGVVVLASIWITCMAVPVVIIVLLILRHYRKCVWCFRWYPSSDEEDSISAGGHHLSPRFVIEDEEDRRKREEEEARDAATAAALAASEEYRDL